VHLFPLGRRAQALGALAGSLPRPVALEQVARPLLARLAGRPRPRGTWCRRCSPRPRAARPPARPAARALPAPAVRRSAPRTAAEVWMVAMLARPLMSG